jgi:hypothetical protein
MHDDLAVEPVPARSPDARDWRRTHAGERRVGHELQIVHRHSERVRERLRLSPWMPRLQRVLSELFVDAVPPLGIRQQLADLVARTRGRSCQQPWMAACRSAGVS